jgi:hypothetical protein
VTAVQKFFDDGIMPDDVNDTTIVLTQKKKTSEELKDYRPIDMCNVLYKIVSKCMVNQLRPLLREIISPFQSAFIPRRLITDNVLIAFECIHAIQNGNRANF